MKITALVALVTYTQAAYATIGDMEKAMEESKLKTDAETIQKTNTADLATAEAADDKDSTTDTKAKVAEYKKWVAAGEKILTNVWNDDKYAQDWQFTWFQNKCEALKTKDETHHELISLEYNLSLTEQKLADAKKLEASTAKQVTTAEADVKEKTTDRENARADKEVGAEGKMAWNSAVEALANANANKVRQDDAHTAASADVAEWNAKIVVINKWSTWTSARLTNTYQAHQVTWMSNKIAGMNSKKSAEAVQTANAATLATHTTAEATAKGDAKKTLESQVKQETAWVKSGKAALVDADNLNVWHTNALKAATSITSTKALLDEDTKACTAKAGSQACTWKTQDQAQLTTLEAAKKTRDTANAKATATVKANQKSNEKTTTTKAEARAELATLRSNATEATHKLAGTAAAIKAGDCKTTNAATEDCVKLTRTYNAEDLSAKAATAAVEAQTTYLSTNTFPTSSDATIAIIILVVSAVVCISGGLIWNWHDKKAAAKKLAEEKALEAAAPGGDVEAVPEMEAAMFVNDDCYKAMVDAEY